MYQVHPYGLLLKNWKKKDRFSKSYVVSITNDVLKKSILPFKKPLFFLNGENAQESFSLGREKNLKAAVHLGFAPK